MNRYTVVVFSNIKFCQNAKTLIPYCSDVSDSVPVTLVTSGESATVTTVWAVDVVDSIILGVNSKVVDERSALADSGRFVVVPWNVVVSVKGMASVVVNVEVSVRLVTLETVAVTVSVE